MKKRIVKLSAAALIGAAALLYLYFTGEGQGAGIPCVFHQVTGFFCSGCGSSRALRSILHLDFYQALRYNAFFTLLLPFMAVYFSFLGYSYIRFDSDKISNKIPKELLIAVVVIGVAFGVLRNIPFLAFLAPTTLT